MNLLNKLLTPALSILLLVTASNGIAQTNRLVDPTKDLSAIQKKYGLDPNTTLISRLTRTPDDVMDIFREAGMAPTEHKMTPQEKRILAEAIAVLPPLHQRVLKQHLKSISFVDNMPNTAITAPVTKDENNKLFHIAFRAGILHQTISEWVTDKEKKCYGESDSTISVSIHAGLMSALTYVLLHEGTHVVDGSLGLLGADSVSGRLALNEFTVDFSRDIWSSINILAWPFTDSLVLKSIFRPGGRRFVLSEAKNVYRSLSQTPFISLYATASWHEDLAELLTVYHLAKMLNQPFQIIVNKNGQEIARYEPVLSPVVQKRFMLLAGFYEIPII